MEAFEVRNLTFSYKGKEKKALNDVSFSVSKGDFFVICGYSGCGKTTLLRLLKPSVSPSGEKSGDIYFFDEIIENISPVRAVSEIGFVTQSPESQTVTDKVWHELAFSLESLGFDNDTIKRRTAEMAAFFGIDDWFYNDVSALSGGQKQLLALASVMTLQPSVLILDEPTSQLDPIAASEFLAALSKINRETGTTIILSEHRLEEALAYANKAMVMENGKVIAIGKPDEVGLKLKELKSPMFLSMPAPMRVWSGADTEYSCPITVNEGREFLSNYTKTHTPASIEYKNTVSSSEEILRADNIYFCYDKEGKDVLKNMSLSLKRGEIFCLLGSNGSGKSTCLRVLGGLRKPVRGNIETNCRTAFLPQDAKSLFVRKTVLSDLYDSLKSSNLSEDECRNKIEEIANICEIEEILDCHPYDISGGEQQKAAIAKILLSSPDILLLDEPTKGLDSAYKQTLAQILINLRNSGKTILIVSHDVEFCALYADRCGLFFDGNVVSASGTREFFKKNSFYTTAADRMARGIIPDVLTTEDIISSLSLENFCQTKIVKKYPQRQIIIPKDEIKKLPLARKIGAAVCAVSAFIILIIASLKGEILDFATGEGITGKGIEQLIIYGVFVLAMIMLAVFLGQREMPKRTEFIKKKEKLPKRTLVAAAISLLFIPLTLFAGLRLLPVKQYYVTSLLVIAECMLPFLFVFEGRKRNPREIVIVSVLCAVAVAGRAAFFMLPQFKPVVAVVIISGLMLGAEDGFLVGAVTMLVSNMLFSQGPWTPWQMFAMGLIGFLTGVLSQKGILRKSRLILCLYGFLTTLIIYGVIVNTSTALIWNTEEFNFNILLGYYITGFPMDLIHAVSTVIFLWFGANPLVDILERVKIKYDLN